MPNSPSPFIWYELMTPDPQAAAEFYSHVAGWTIADSGLTDRQYNMVNAGSVGIGGIMGYPPGYGENGGRPVWLGYIYSTDVDADAKRVASLGGSVMREPTDIPMVGRFSVVADPHGAAFYLFKPSSTATPDKVPPNTPGHVGWRELHSGDWKEAWPFYEALFGWRKGTAMDMGALGTYQIFQINGEDSGGMMTKMADMPRAMWMYYVNVPSVTAAKARLEEKGGKVLMGPHQVPTGQWIITAMDPQGAMFSLLSPVA